MDIELTELGLQIVEQIKNISPIIWTIAILVVAVLFGYASYSLWKRYLWNNRLSTYAIGEACGILAGISLMFVVLSLIFVLFP